MTTPAEKVLTRLTVAADEQLVVPVRDFCSRVLARAGIPEGDLPGFDLLVEEACLHVVRTAFDPGTPGGFDISVVRRPNQVAILVEDQGLPEDPRRAHSHDPEQVGVVLMRAFAHEVVFRNLGKAGKRLELIRNLGPGLPEGHAAPQAEPPVAGDAVAIRMMTEADAPSLARCLWRTYGYSYVNEDIYFPERVTELLRGGLLVSAVAVNAAEEVVGHVAIELETPGARVAECGVAVVDPRYRGHHLFERLLRCMTDWAARAGMLGLFAHAVAAHPFSQKGILAGGAVETGVVPGYLPPGLDFHGIRDPDMTERGDVVLLWLKTTEAPSRISFAPPQHAQMLRRICDHAGLARDWQAPPDDLESGVAPPARTTLVLRVIPEQGRAELRIAAHGMDAIEAVRAHVKELDRHGIACTLLELPLGDPLTAVLCGEFERMGFGFAGLGVEAAEGDTLVLVRLRGVPFDPALVTVTDHGRALAGYVLAMRAEADRRMAGG